MQQHLANKFLTHPKRVANTLDWCQMTGCLMNMVVHKHQLEMVIVSHPALGDDPFQDRCCIPLRFERTTNSTRHQQSHSHHHHSTSTTTTTTTATLPLKIIHESVLDELHSILRDYHVCGMVVGWPTQAQGWCGKEAGRTMHTLDLMAWQSKSILGWKRPLCLWAMTANASKNTTTTTTDTCSVDSSTSNETESSSSSSSSEALLEEDCWGRSPLYSQQTNKTLHLASVEQYPLPAITAMNVWNDFFRVHWPDLYREQVEPPMTATATTSLVASWSGENLQPFLAASFS